MEVERERISNHLPANNPYAPPNDAAKAVGEEPGKGLEYPLGKVYWRLMISTLMINVLLVFTPLLYQLADGKSRPLLPNIFLTPAIGLGLFGGMISGFALTYGLAYARRVVRRNYTRRYNEIRAQQFDFFARGMLFGALLTISTLTAFVCCCVPISLPFISYSAGGMAGNNTSPATAFAVLIALVAGGFMIFKLLPREDLR